MAYTGGNWNNGAIDGLFCLNVNNAASNSNTNIGGRLANDYSQKTASPPGRRPVHILWGHCPDHAVEDKRGAAASSWISSERGSAFLYGFLCLKQ